MTIEELTEIVSSCPYKSKQVVFTLGYRKLRVKELSYSHQDANPVEIELEEVKE
jgi:hypothetical protein